MLVAHWDFRNDILYMHSQCHQTSNNKSVVPSEPSKRVQRKISVLLSYWYSTLVTADRRHDVHKASTFMKRWIILLLLLLIIIRILQFVDICCWLDWQSLQLLKVLITPLFVPLWSSIKVRSITSTVFHKADMLVDWISVNSHIYVFPSEQSVQKWCIRLW